MRIDDEDQSIVEIEEEPSPKKSENSFDESLLSTNPEFSVKKSEVHFN